MLIAGLARLEQYGDKIPGLTEALAWLNANKDAPVGKYPLDKGFVMVQEGTTKPTNEGNFEAHRAYLDVQLLLGGSEYVVWCDIAALTPVGEYDAASDKAHFSGVGSVFQIRPGDCYLCWPEDGHKACRAITTPTSYRKAVVKLPLL